MGVEDEGHGPILSSFRRKPESFVLAGCAAFAGGLGNFPSRTGFGRACTGNSLAALLAVALAAGACVVEDAEQEANQQQAPAANAQTPAAVDPAVAAARQKARADLGEVEFVVDLSDRQLRILQGDRVLRTERVAVGSDEYPTPVGRWHFQRVDINPDWTPPDSEWAKKRKPSSPAKRTIRWAARGWCSPRTTASTAPTRPRRSAPTSRTARFASPTAVLDVARLLLQAGGAFDGNDWFNRMTADRTRMHRIDLEHPVEISVVE